MRGMSMGMGITPALLASASVAAIDAPFAVVLGAGAYNGGFVEYGSQPTLTENVPFDVDRLGYNSSAQAVLRRERFYVVKTASPGGAVRKPYPLHGTQSDLMAALSDYLYSSDIPAGSVTNNSTFESPVVVVNWGTADRRLIGDTIGGSTIPVHVVPAHRNASFGQEVACVVFSVSGLVSGVPTTLPDIVVGTSTVVELPGDINKVCGFALPATDVSSFDTGSVVVNGKAYPWVGTATGIADSSTSSTRRNFSPQYFYKNTAKFASPDIMYVKTTGNDATAQVNDPAFPALTIVGAINRMRTGSTGAPWNSATTQIRILDAGTFSGATTGSGVTTAQLAGLVITRDAGVPLASAVIQLGASSFNPNINTAAGPGTGCVIFTDVTLIRSGGASNPFRGASLELQIDNCAFNASTLNTAWFSSSGTGQTLVMIGTTITNNTAGGFGAVLYAKQHLWRGVRVTSPGTVEVNTMLGCEITTPSALAAASSLTQDNTIVAFNSFLKITGSMLNFTTNITLGAAVLQNLFEFIGTNTTAFLALAASNDAATNSTVHIIIHNNTFAGAYAANRNNLFYDEGATHRTNVLQSVVGNILVSPATKGDRFVGVNEAGQPWAADAPNRTGNWGFLFGIGCRGNFYLYIDANSGGIGSSTNQEFVGLESVAGTSNTTPNDPLFVNNKATTYSGGVSGTYTAGLGGGDYNVSALSPCKGLLTNGVLPADLVGTARTYAADTVGALKAA